VLWLQAETGSVETKTELVDESSSRSLERRRQSQHSHLISGDVLSLMLCFLFFRSVLRSARPWLSRQRLAVGLRHTSAYHDATSETPAPASRRRVQLKATRFL